MPLSIEEQLDIATALHFPTFIHRTFKEVAPGQISMYQSHRCDGLRARPMPRWRDEASDHQTFPRAASSLSAHRCPLWHGLWVTTLTLGSSV